MRPIKSKLVAIRSVQRAEKWARRSPSDLAKFLTEELKGLPYASYEEAESSKRAILETGPRMRGKYCLQRSIATVLHCAQFNRKRVKIAIGARIDPFQAHAWVVADGRPVEDFPVEETFKVLLEV